MASGAIQQGETVAVPRARGLTLPFDPILLLTVIALAVCSVIAVGAATADDIAGNPRYFVTRQAVYFAVGGVAGDPRSGAWTTRGCARSRS